MKIETLTFNCTRDTLYTVPDKSEYFEKLIDAYDYYVQYRDKIYTLLPLSNYLEEHFRTLKYSFSVDVKYTQDCTKISVTGNSNELVNFKLRYL